MLLSQSLILFAATRESLIDATTRVWPEKIELWPTVLVLSMNAGLMIFSLGNSLSNQELISGMILGYFWNHNLAKYLTNTYTALLVISSLTTMGTFILGGVLLKTRPLNVLPLGKIACALAAITDRYDQSTICHSHVSPSRIFFLTSGWCVHLYNRWKCTRHFDHIHNSTPSYPATYYRSHTNAPKDHSNTIERVQL